MPVIVFMQMLSLILYFTLKYDQVYSEKTDEPIMQRLSGVELNLFLAIK
jgi:hypothetical protein